MSTSNGAVVSTTSRELVPTNSLPRNFQGSAGLLTSLSDVTKLATLYAQSGFFVDSKQMAQAAVKILYGLDLGFSPSAAMTGIYIVKGRVTLSANAMAAVIGKTKTHRIRVKHLDATRAAISFQMKDEDTKKWEEIGMSSFTMEEAKTAGLTGNDTYKKYPRNMLYARAISNGAKWFCPELFLGITPYLPEELDQNNVPDEAGNYDLQSLSATSQAIVELPAEMEEKLRLEVSELVKTTNTELSTMLGHYKVGSVAELTGEKLSKCYNLLSIKKSKLEAEKQVQEAEIVEAPKVETSSVPVAVIHENAQ
jgi:hypothetical protein